MTRPGCTQFELHPSLIVAYFRARRVNPSRLPGGIRLLSPSRNGGQSLGGHFKWLSSSGSSVSSGRSNSGGHGGSGGDGRGWGGGGDRGCGGGSSSHCPTAPPPASTTVASTGNAVAAARTTVHNGITVLHRRRLAGEIHRHAVRPRPLVPRLAVENF